MRFLTLATAGLWMTVLTVFATAIDHVDRPGAALQTHEVIILGEVHDDPGHHEAQADIIRQMGAAGQRPSLVFEMIPVDLQDALDTYRRANPDDIDGLAEVLKWRERGWGDFGLYRPLFSAAVELELPILAGDLPSVEREAISGGGFQALAPERIVELGLEPDLPGPLRESMAEALDEGHCRMLPAEAIPRMIDVQRARDGSMAQAAIAAARAGPVVIITGQGHARRDWGIPYVLGRLAPELGVYTVTFSADPLASKDGVFDAVEAVPPMIRDSDPCEAFRKSE